MTTTRRLTECDDDVRALIGELDAELSSLSPPEQCHGLALFSDFAEVKRMYVRPAARSTGIADAVMESETGADFPAANRFYRRWGVAPCAIFEPYASKPSKPSKPSYTVAASAFLKKRLS